MWVDLGIRIVKYSFDLGHDLFLSSFCIYNDFLLLPNWRLILWLIICKLSHATLLLGCGTSILDVVLKNLVAVSI